MKLKQLKKVSDCFVCNCLQCSKVMQLKCTVFIKIICTGVHQRAKKRKAQYIENRTKNCSIVCSLPIYLFSLFISYFFIQFLTYSRKKLEGAIL